MIRAFAISVGIHVFALFLVWSLGFLPPPFPQLMPVNLADLLAGGGGGGGGTPGLPPGPLGGGAPPPPPKPKTVAVNLKDAPDTINGLPTIKRPIKEAPKPIATPKATPVPTPKPESTPKPKVLKSVTETKVVKTKVKEIVEKLPEPEATPKPKEVAAATPKVEIENIPKAPVKGPEIDIGTLSDVAAPAPSIDLASSGINMGAAGNANSLGNIQGGGGGGGGNGIPGLPPGYGTGDGYGSKVLWLIQSNFKPPYTMPGVSCVVGFHIMKDGTLDSWSITRSCGRTDLDQAALRALAETGKVAPLYDGFPKQFMEAEVTFFFEAPK